MDRRTRIGLFLSVVVLALVAFLYSSLPQASFVSRDRTPEAYLFDEVSGFKLEREVTGTEALAAVKASHMGSLKTPSDTAIGYYQEGLTIWVSKYKSAKTANRETNRMVDAISRFGRGFRPPEKLTINDVGVFRTYFGDSFQYFWSKEGFIIYVIPGLLGEDEVKALVGKINGTF